MDGSHSIDRYEKYLLRVRDGIKEREGEVDVKGRQRQISRSRMIESQTSRQTERQAGKQRDTDKDRET